jgi:hypothetical protein
MGRWAQAHRRGGVGVGGVLPVPPILACTPPLALSWYWPGVNPHDWRIDVATTGLEDWGSTGTVDGALRNGVAIFANSDYRVVGIDGGGVPVTPYSNRTHVP